MDQYEQIAKIYNEQYLDKFEFPDLSKSIGNFTEKDDSDKVILFGSLQLIPEIVLITDMNSSLRARHKALYSFLDKVENSAKQAGFNQVHIFPEDDKIWQRRLQKDGFKPTKYPAFVKLIGE